MISKVKNLIGRIVKYIGNDYNWLAVIGIGILIVASVLDYQNKGKPFDYITIISSFGTLTIAFIGIKGYGKIVINKVNEKQLEKVLELLEELTKPQFKIKVVYKNQQTFTREVRISELWRDYNVIQQPRIANIIGNPMINNQSNNSKISQEKILDVNYRKVKLTQSAANKLSELANYKHEVLLPEYIANALKAFQIEPRTQFENNNQRKMFYISDFQNNEYIILDVKSTQNIEEEASILFEKDWTTFRANLKKLKESIYQWSKQKNIDNFNMGALSD